jgi:integron integrase
MLTPHQDSLPLRPRLLDQVRDAIRRKHYSLRTEQSYSHWIKRHILFHRKRHPAELGASHVTAFLNQLATAGQVSASTQNQALAALLFLYREVLEIKLPWLDGLTRAKRPQRLPTVLTQAEVRSLLDTLEGTRWLMVTLLYGAGMRLSECLGLRVKDVDFEGRQRLIRDGKGGKDRVSLLPGRVIDPLRVHLEQVKRRHDADLAAGLGEAALPFALAKKYPKAGFGRQRMYRHRLP